MFGDKNFNVWISGGYIQTIADCKLNNVKKNPKVIFLKWLQYNTLCIKINIAHKGNKKETIGLKENQTTEKSAKADMHFVHCIDWEFVFLTQR